MTTILIQRISPVSQHSPFVSGPGSSRLCWSAALLGLLAPLTLSLLVPQEALANTIKPADVRSLPAAPSKAPNIVGQQAPSDLAGITFEEPVQIDNFASTTDLGDIPISASQAGEGGIALTRSTSAHVAVARARQLMAYGASELVERELRHAVALAPQWIEAQRELASWYSRQQQWQLAAPAWGRVTLLLNQQKSKTSAPAYKKAMQAAQAAYAVARGHIQPRSSVPKLVAYGESSDMKLAGQDVGTVRVVAAIRPMEQKQAAPTAVSNPNTYTVSLSTVPPRSTPVLLAQAPGRRASSGVGATRATTTAARLAAKQLAPTVSQQRQAQAWPFVERATKAMQARNYNTALTLYQNAFKLDPNNQYAQSGVAEALMLLKRYPAAETAYRRALSARPNDVKLRRGLADVLTFQNKREAAIQQYRQVLAQNPRDFASTYQMAQILAWSKRYDESSAYFRRAAALQPNNAEVWAAWGEVLSYNHDTEARSTFAQALRLQPGNTRALLGQANLFTWNGEYPQAIANYQNLLAREPRNVAALIGLGNALTYSGDREAAAQQYRAALLIEPNSAEANLGLGRALVYAREFTQGASYLQRALASNPGNVEALQLLAQAQANSPVEGETTSDAVALATYQRLLTLQTDPEAQAATWMSIAQLREKQDNYEDARAAYTEAMRLAPDNTEIPLVFAQSLMYEDQWAEARRVVDTVLRREPDNARALTMQVMIESKSGTPERAAALARRIQVDALTSPEDALMLAQALERAGQPEAAARVIQQLAAMPSDNPTVALQIATAVRDSGQYESAIALYQRLIAAHPDNAAARLKLAETLIWTKQFDAAQQQVDAVIAADAKNIEARVLLATINAREGTEESRTAALNAVENIIREDPSNVAARILEGDLKTSRRLFADAINSFSAAVEADPTNLQARLGLARNLYYAKRTTDAIKEYQELIRRAPADSTVKLELARVYLDQNELSRAEELFRDIVVASRMVLPPAISSNKVGTIRAYARVSPSLAMPAPVTRTSRSTPSARAGLRLAQAATAPTGTGGGDAAGNTARDTGGTAPADDAGINGTGTFGAPTNGTGTNVPAVPATTATGETEPTPNDFSPLPEVPAPATGAGNTPEGGITNGNGAINGATAGAIETPLENQVAALRGLGEIRRRQNRYDESISLFEQALRLDPADAASRLGLAQSLRGKGEYVRALAEVDRVVSTDNTNLPARVLRAQLLGDTGQPQQAQTELDAVVASLPETPTMETYLQLAGAFTGLRNYDTALLLLRAAREDYPDRPEPLRRTGEVLTFARRWDEAEAVFNQLIAADPQDAEAALGKARVYNYSARLEQAEGLYRRVLEIDPENQVALIELGNVLTRRSNWGEAIRLYRTAIERNPSDLATRVELARVLRYNRQYEASEAALNQVLAADARYAPALTERGILRGQQGNYDPAIADLRQAVAITPTDTLAQLGLAEVLGYADQYDESIGIYRAVLTREPDNEKAQVELGLVLSYAGRNEEALAQLNAVTAKNPQNVSAQTGKASVLARMRRVDEAIAIYQSILRTDPQNRRAQTGLASAYVTGRRYADAIAIYDQLIAAEPTNTGYRIGRARTLGYSRNYPAAIAALRTIVQAEPTNTDARLALAEALTNSGVAANRTDAIAQYQTVLRTEPDNIDARVGLGRVYSYTRNYREAERELRTVLAKYPNNPDALYALAETQRFAGQSFEAEENYERVLRNRPNDVNAQENLALVQRDTAPMFTVSGRSYRDSNGVRLRSFTFGPTFPTPYGTIGLTAERGTFEDDGVAMRRRALNLLLARRFGPVQARLILSRVSYSAAPSKTLFDLLLQRTQGSRNRVYAGVRELDIIESLGAVQAGIEARQWRVGMERALGERFDLDLEARYNQYSDDNTRRTLLAAIYYRIQREAPTLRIGLGARLEDSRFDSPLYYTPQNLRSLDALADYRYDTGGRMRFGLSASIPLVGGGDDGVGGNDRRDTKTLFGYFNYDLSELIELFINGGIVRGSEYRSNDFTLGANFRFR